jgi:hypothetical protein
MVIKKCMNAFDEKNEIEMRNINLSPSMHGKFAFQEINGNFLKKK